MRKAGTKIGPPGAPPRVRVVEVFGRRVMIRLSDRESPRRGRPSGVAGAAVFGYVGAKPPTDLFEWRFMGNTASTKLTIEFPAHLTPQPGSQVWITAYWISPRMERGPAAAAIYTYTMGGLSLAA